MDADAEFHLAVADVEGGLARRGYRAEVSATPIERVALLTLSPSALSASRTAPSSAAAPTIFSTTSVPATPRRPVV